MNNELIINGITYVRKEEPAKDKRIEGWIDIRFLNIYGYTTFTKHEDLEDTTRVIEIREGERVLSRDDVIKAWNECINVVPPVRHRDKFLKDLGFDE